MFMYNPVGKTLLQVHKDCGSNLNGYSVFILQDAHDAVGKCIGDGISIGECLHYEDTFAQYVVKLENDFFGMTVLRAIHPDLWTEVSR